MEVGPRFLRRHGQRSTGVVVAPIRAGRLATPAMISSLTATVARDGTDDRSDDGVATVDQPEACGIGRVDHERTAVPSPHQRRRVVHPRIVGTDMSAADEQHPVGSVAESSRQSG